MNDIRPVRSTNDAIDQLKVPPHATDAEKAVIGGLLLVASAWDKVASKLAVEDFYQKNHQHIFKAITYLNENQQACDVVTVSDWLEAHGLTEQSGGLDYLAELAANTPGASNVEAYAGIVREKSVLRQLIQIGNELAEKAFSPETTTADEMIEEAEKLVFQIREQTLKSRSGFHDIKEVLKETIENLELLAENDGDITGLPYGWVDLDKKTAGLQRSDLIIVAGRPAMGKTSFAMNVAERAAITGSSVAIFSMEMAAHQLVMRMFSSLSQINQADLKRGKLKDSDWPKLGQSSALLSQSKLFIDDQPALSPNEIMSRCRRLKNRHGLDLIVIDYLQLMQIKGKVENRANEISEISRNLKAMAKELDVPVIALSQLNRSLEQRPNKRPVMSDLRESGAIEQDADLIIFIYRDEVYNPDSQDKGKAEIILGKHRNGSIGKIDLTFRGQFTRFDNYENDILLEDPGSDFH
ncbi:replicative DNA helicase [Marinicella meishanensis]|uniref:replicative DNA helicase n=1 Tax=Marinicella meishanensis TaxID=2873263 RepID=UPI001CBAF02E|nr:replicative DNA helicase [Marinicella sp. NBU2979]